MTRIRICESIKIYRLAVVLNAGNLQVEFFANPMATVNVGKIPIHENAKIVIIQIPDRIFGPRVNF